MNQYPIRQREPAELGKIRNGRERSLSSSKRSKRRSVLQTGGRDLGRFLAEPSQNYREDCDEENEFNSSYTGDIFGGFGVVTRSCPREGIWMRINPRRWYLRSAIVKVSISEGHPLARCLVTTQFSSGAIPLVLTDVLLNEEQGVRLRYLGDAGAVLDGVGEFTTEILLTADLPQGTKLSNVGFGYQFIPDYMAP